MGLVLIGKLHQKPYRSNHNSINVTRTSQEAWSGRPFSMRNMHNVGKPVGE